MLSTTSRDLNLVVSHTTAAASSVSDWVARHYGLPVQQCYLIRRNLNDNYAVLATDGSRYVARLCAIRPRGAFNVIEFWVENRVLLELMTPEMTEGYLQATRFRRA